MEDDYNEVKKNWWSRNWKWFVPTGCVSLLLIFVLCIVGVFYEMTNVIEKSDAYKGAIVEVQHNKLAAEKLGSEIKSNGMTSGSININNNTSNCDVKIPVKGSKGTGTLYVVAHKRDKWTYDELSIHIDATNEDIDLLKK